MQQFRIWADDYYLSEKYKLKDKARKSLINWDAAELIASQLNRLKFKLAHNYYEVEKLKAETDYLTTSAVGSKHHKCHARIGISIDKSCQIYAV